MTIHMINHVALGVEDLEKAIAFYSDVIGLARLPRPQMSVPGAWFDLGASQLHLVSGRTEPVHTAIKGSHFAIGVSDFPSYAQLLKDQDVEIVREMANPSGIRMIFFKDVDGYIVEFIEQSDG
jgi:glyoxylase I family protein